MFLQNNQQVKTRRGAEQTENVQEVTNFVKTILIALRTEVSLLYGF